MQTRLGGLIALALVATILIGAISNCDPPLSSDEEAEAHYQAKLAPHRPACEKLYDQEVLRLDAAARALGAVAIPANPTLAELRALLGKPDYYPSLALSQRSFNQVGLQYARYAWRQVVPRWPGATNKAGVVDGCAQDRIAHVDPDQWRKYFSAIGHDTPVAVEAGYSEPAFRDDSRPALLQVQHPFRGTLAGFSLDVDASTFRARAIELGWQRSATPQGETFRKDHFILTTAMLKGRVEKIDIWDARYEVMVCPLPGSSDSCRPVSSK